MVAMGTLFSYKSKPCIGFHGSERQLWNQTGPVWFIAGTFGEKQTAKRSCSIPSGKAILFPVINYEMNELENLSIKAGPDLIKHVKEDIDDIVTKEAKVDNELIPIYWVQSDPEIFNLYINDNNSMGIVGGTYQSRCLTATGFS